ncbi:hypothetical protein Q8A73_017959 [Channa argus]|nr:hypothetical protein Q8A73_017959 [Channa argus]
METHVHTLSQVDAGPQGPCSDCEETKRRLNTSSSSLCTWDETVKDELQREQKNTGGWTTVLHQTRAANPRKQHVIHTQTFERQLDNLDRISEVNGDSSPLLVQSNCPSVSRFLLVWLVFSVCGRQRRSAALTSAEQTADVPAAAVRTDKFIESS